MTPHQDIADERVGTLLLERYRIDALVGRGGMSLVYRAFDTMLRRTIALKVFRDHLVSADDLQRQRDELQLLAGLQHPTLVTLFDAVSDGVDRVSLVLEWVEGSDLRDVLDVRPLSRRETAGVGADIADALAYVHGQGIVHRDLKPGNLLIPDRTADGRMPLAKLTDFGIARLVDSTRLTGTGAVIGTAGYLSPEQALGHSVGTASDVYSLGLVLLECLTGARPFEGTGIASAVARVTRDADVPVELGPGWGSVLTGMLDRDPDKRMSAEEARDRLRVIAVEESSTDGSVVVSDTLSDETVELAAGSLSESRTRVLPAVAAEPRTEILSGSTAPDSRTEVIPAVSAPPGPARGSARAAEQQDSRVPDEGREPKRRMSTTAIVVLVVLVLAAAAAAVAVAITTNESADPAPVSVDYPAVEGDVGLNLEELQRSVEP